ncbi:MAG TPA: hypothetical protein VFE38_03420 [Edaphobacter sp.]|nr:hypothetical protein [Edaphobacter sp.]
MLRSKAFEVDDLRQVGESIAQSRREFLCSALKMGTAAAMLGFSPLRASAFHPGRKIVVVTFGGGARDEETFAPEGQRNIPNLVTTLLPQSTFFGRVVNRGILGHYVATASLATGSYETFDNFAAVAPHNPTIFEYFRKGLNRPAYDAWVVAPSNGFNRIGQSDNRSFGAGLGAEVILPKHLLNAATLAANRNDYKHLLRDNYEEPYYTPQLAGSEVELQQIENILRISLAEFRAHALTLSSPDELSVYIARQLMKRFAPSLLWITLHDMDVAHSGAYSLYIEGIHRTDKLCADLWKAVQTEPEYANKTTMFILPDFGRDSDFTAGGNGFQHHRTGDALSRTTWMMALGAGVREGAFIDRPVDSLDLVPTLGALLRVPTPLARGRLLREILNT